MERKGLVKINLDHHHHHPDYMNHTPIDYFQLYIKGCRKVVSQGNCLYNKTPFNYDLRPLIWNL